jgi:6-phosphogluconate dehydrogenase
MKQATIGLIGLAVMGANLARNLAGHEIPTAVFNRTTSKTDAFIEQYGNDFLKGCHTLEELVGSLEKPRRILLMVKAGKPVDILIDQLVPLLDKNDILIDGGNSFYEDTIRRTQYLESKGIHFVGMGISGGEEGALHGPSLMPGGSDESYQALKPILEAMAAKAEGEPCVTHIGTDGAGHYVKMVHNGIEYADMQLISDVYSIMKDVLHMSHEEMKSVWESWGKGRLNSYLIDITAIIMGKQDSETGKPLLECVLDVAGQKGTGRWTSLSALNLGIPTPTITEAVFARCLSACRPMRLKASRILKKPASVSLPVSKEQILSDLEQALYASKICAYAQGFHLMRAAGEEFGWKLDFAAISRIWRNGCIIRAGFLNTLSDIFTRHPDLENLILDEHFSQALLDAQEGWSRVVSLAGKAGAAVPGLSSALQYFNSCRTEYTNANLIQAQRDFFGAHTYQRIDKKGTFHSEWSE